MGRVEKGVARRLLWKGLYRRQIRKRLQRTDARTNVAKRLG
jgi:hypothetical protein